MAKLYQHRTNGTYYTKRNLGAGSMTWQIHPDGVSFLKQQGVIIGTDIPSYAMHILHDRSWLFTREEAGQWPELDWAPAWESLGRTPVGVYQLWLSRQTRDRAALLAASRRLAEGEQLAHHKEEAALLKRRLDADDSSHHGNLAYFPIAPRPSTALLSSRATAAPERGGEAAIALSPAHDSYLASTAASGMPAWLGIIGIALVGILLASLAL